MGKSTILTGPLSIAVLTRPGTFGSNIFQHSKVPKTILSSWVPDLSRDLRQERVVANFGAGKCLQNMTEKPTIRLGNSRDVHWMFIDLTFRWTWGWLVCGCQISGRPSTIFSKNIQPGYASVWHLMIQVIAIHTHKKRRDKNEDSPGPNAGIDEEFRQLMCLTRMTCLNF